MLVCPRDRLALADLRCPDGHRYPSYDGIPVLLLDDVPETNWTYGLSIRQALGQAPIRYDEPISSIDGYVQTEIAGTNGFLYLPLVGRLTSYPIPELPLPSGSGQTLVDIGCNWGRWSIAATRKSYRVTGVDSSLDALLSARRVARQLGIEADFICADARYLPFPDGSFDQSFSFSVLQHFSKQDARLAFAEMRRVSRRMKVEIPGKYGLRALYHQLKRGFKDGAGFDVRYWSPKDLREIGDVSVHAYFGTGILPDDTNLLPARYRLVVHASRILTRLSDRVPLLANVADSYYVS